MKKNKLVCLLIAVALICTGVSVPYTYAEGTDPEIYILGNNKFNSVDFNNNENMFYIQGFNFNDKIKKITLENVNGEKTLDPSEIKPTDIEFKDATKIDVHIRNELSKQLSNRANAGDYAVSITFSATPSTVTGSVYDTVASSVYSTYNEDDRESKIYLHIEAKPKLKGKYPYSDGGKPLYDEKTLKHDAMDDVTKDKYFIKVIFDDIEGKLDLNNIEDLKECIVRPEGGTGNLVDKEFINDVLNNKEHTKYVFKKENQEVTLYMPVKPLREQNTYEVFIPADIVNYTDTMEGNEAINWKFMTMSKPLVTHISLGSISEEYDEDEPLYIYGNFFDIDGDKVKVYFDDIEAEEAEVISGKEIKVYLPDGSDRLDPGTYDIIVENDENHKRTVYGSLAVIQSGDEEDIPNEEYKIKEDGSMGEVRSNLKVSEDTLFISPSDIDEKELEVDLDELMGEDVLVRKIQYEGDKRCNIGELKTKSRHADITLYGVTLDPYAEDDTIDIRLGRTEPTVTQVLKRKLRGKGLKSDFIQVSGENYKIENVRLDIPIKYNSGKNIKVLRYDEYTRNFYEIPYTVNLVDRKVEFMAGQKGIFVVVNK